MERSGRLGVDEAHQQDFVEQDQHSTTQDLAEELDVSPMSSSRNLLRINLTYKFNP